MGSCFCFSGLCACAFALPDGTHPCLRFRALFWTINFALYPSRPHAPCFPSSHFRALVFRARTFALPGSSRPRASLCKSTTRREKPEKNQLEQNSWDGTSEWDKQNQTAIIRLRGQESQDRTTPGTRTELARVGLPAQAGLNTQNGTIGTKLPGQK